MQTKAHELCRDTSTSNPIGTEQNCKTRPTITLKTIDNYTFNYYQLFRWFSVAAGGDFGLSWNLRALGALLWACPNPSQPPNKSEHARNSTQEQAFSASCKRSGESSKHSQARILCHTISQTGYVDHRWQRGNVATHYVHQNMNGRGQLARTYHEADIAFLEFLEASSNTIANDACVCSALISADPVRSTRLIDPFPERCMLQQARCPYWQLASKCTVLSSRKITYLPNNLWNWEALGEKKQSWIMRVVH